MEAELGAVRMAFQAGKEAEAAEAPTRPSRAQVEAAPMAPPPARASRTNRSESTPPTDARRWAGAAAGALQLRALSYTVHWSR